MSTRQHLEVFAEWVVAQAPDGEPDSHLGEDLMVAAALGTLTDEERVTAKRHLARCATCREMLRFAMDDGEEPPARWRSRLPKVAVLLALAAGVVLAVGLWTMWPEGAADGPLAQARQALDGGDPDEAYRVLTGALDRAEFAGDERAHAEVMLTEAVVARGSRLLDSSRFDELLRLAVEAAGRGISSPEIDVLVFAATLGSTTPVVLEGRYTLADLGVRVDAQGRLLRGQPKAQDEVTRRLGDLIRAAHERAPADRAVRLNHAYWLLMQNRPAQARPVFEGLTREAPADRAAWVGLGLAAVLMEDGPAAVTAFDTARELGSDRVLEDNLEAARRLRDP